MGHSGMAGIGFSTYYWSLIRFSSLHLRTPRHENTSSRGNAVTDCSLSCYFCVAEEKGINPRITGYQEQVQILKAAGQGGISVEVCIYLAS